MKLISKKIKVKDHTFHYLESGNEDIADKDRTILCIHGLPGSSTDYRKIAEHLKSTCRIVAVDLLGNGKSDKPMDEDYAIETQADYIVRLAAILNLRNVIVIGHSYGGAVSQAVVASDPNRFIGLVLLASIGFVPHILYKKLIMPMRVFALLLMVPKSYKFIKPLALHGFKRIGFPEQFANDKRLLLIVSKSAARIDFRTIAENAERIACPTVYISCTHDPYVQPAVRIALSEKIKKFQYVELEGNSHMVQFTHAGQVAEAVTEFLPRTVVTFPGHEA